ncbi:MAG: bifunctional oligoribonuclease/PAP phosphatase NrnA [Candidatus Delongbacteria bacterium]|nr:bifunctional oligoribonuclease/PAP phosphatase NrnA [Candidatus Delongbacteria bacterium]
MSDPVAKIGSFLKERDNFLITSHYAPDGDNIGACCAVFWALKLSGKKALIVNEDKFVERFGFLLGKDRKAFVRYDDSIDQKYENVIVLDTANFERIGKVKELVAGNAFIVNIDHHPTNDNFGTLNYIDPAASSASEILIKIFRENDISITREISDCLLAGLLSDTGGLRFGNTNIKTIEAVRELMSCGSDLADITDRIFLRLSYSETVKISKIISQIKLFENEKLAVAYNDQVSNPLIENEPVLMTLNSIEEAEVSVFIRKNGEDFYKLSLRSKGDFNVSDFSSKWKGGGHKNAAGIRFYGSLEELENTLLKELKQLCLKYYGTE